MKSLPSKFFCVFAFYAVGSLTAMAIMNLSFLVVLLVWISTYLLFKKSPSSDNSRDQTFDEPYFQFLTEYKHYRFWGLALLVTCITSLTAAKFWPYAYAGHDPEVTVHGYLKIWYLIIPGILLNLFERLVTAESKLQGISFAVLGEKHFRQMLLAWWSMTLALGVMAIIQFNTGWPLKQVIPTNPTHFHAILMFGHHLSTSSILIFPTFTALAIALGAYTRNRSLLKFEWAAGLTGILILFLSYARTAWMAIPIGIILLCVRYLNRKQLIASLVGFFILIAAVSQTSAMKERIHNGMGITERIELWKANFDFFEHRPWTGIGWLKTAEMSEYYFKSIYPDTYRDHFWGHAHSNFFEMLGGTGLIGLLAFLGWSFFTLRMAYRGSKLAASRNAPYWSDFCWGIFVALLLLHFNGLTNVTFWEGKVMQQQMFAVAMVLMVLRFLGARKA